jgi:hypothetical protein
VRLGAHLANDDDHWPNFIAKFQRFDRLAVDDDERNSEEYLDCREFDQVVCDGFVANLRSDLEGFRNDLLQLAYSEQLSLPQVHEVAKSLHQLTIDFWSNDQVDKYFASDVGNPVTDLAGSGLLDALLALRSFDLSRPPTDRKRQRAKSILADMLAKRAKDMTPEMRDWFGIEVLQGGEAISAYRSVQRFLKQASILAEELEELFAENSSRQPKQAPDSLPRTERVTSGWRGEVSAIKELAGAKLPDLYETVTNKAYRTKVQGDRDTLEMNCGLRFVEMAMKTMGAPSRAASTIARDFTGKRLK